MKKPKSIHRAIRRGHIKLVVSEVNQVTMKAFGNEYLNQVEFRMPFKKNKGAVQNGMKLTSLNSHLILSAKMRK